MRERAVKRVFATFEAAVEQERRNVHRRHMLDLLDRCQFQRPLPGCYEAGLRAAVAYAKRRMLCWS